MLQKKSVRFIFSLTAFFLIVTGIFAISKLDHLTYPAILHFDKWNGVDFLGDQSDFLGILCSGLAFIGINLVLAAILFKKERVLAYMFLAANLLLAILLSIFSIVITFNN